MLRWVSKDNLLLLPDGGGLLLLLLVLHQQLYGGLVACRLVPEKGQILVGLSRFFFVNLCDTGLTKALRRLPLWRENLRKGSLLLLDFILKETLQDGLVLEISLPVLAILHPKPLAQLLPPSSFLHQLLSVTAVLGRCGRLDVVTGEHVDRVHAGGSVEPPEVEVIPGVLRQRVVIEPLSDVHL